VVLCHPVDRLGKIGYENPELHMLVQVWRRGRSDQIRIDENVFQSPGGLPPIDTIQDGIAESTTNEEEEQEQEQQSGAWNSRCGMDRTPEACLQDTGLHSYFNVTSNGK
jgi:hypothetical protein